MAEIDTEVKRWGNSLGVRLPRDALRAAGIREGDHVRIHVEKAPAASGIWGMGKRYKKIHDVTFEQMRAEEKRKERARERRRGY